MIDIHHKNSGRVVLQVQGDTLVHANLAGEYLIHANLHGADLSRALLPFANLSGAVLSHANLRGANLLGANLTEVDLTGADLSGANLTDATMQLTVLAGCRNLHEAIGLADIRHPGPSELDEGTLRASAAYLPDVFLRGVGYTRAEIRHLRATYLPENRNEGEPQ